MVGLRKSEPLPTGLEQNLATFLSLLMTQAAYCRVLAQLR